MPLRTTIIGGGISGLTASLFLQQSNCRVNVVEQKSRYTDTDTGGGLCLTWNAVRCLQRILNKREFEGIAEYGTYAFVRQYADGEIVAEEGGREHWMVHRSDLLVLLHRRAQEVGVECLHGESVRRLEERDGSVRVVLESGRVVDSDVVVGADGIGSTVRTTLFPDPDLRPSLTGHRTFLLSISKEYMEKFPETATLYEHGTRPYDLWLGPERTIVSWTMTSREEFHLQITDHNFNRSELLDSREEKNAKYIEHSSDIVIELRKRWSDFTKSVRKALELAPSVMEWRIAEVPELPSWSSSSGRIVLIGDAAHAFAPFAGQGAAMGIEDANVLALLLTRVNLEAVPKAVQVYEETRRPRVDDVRRLVHANTQKYSGQDLEGQLGEGCKSMADMEGKDERLEWLYQYDAAGEVKDIVLQVTSAS